MAESAHTEGTGHAAAGHGGHDAKEHERHYWKVYWILLVLLAVSVMGPFIGEATELFAITLMTAFGVAVVKAALVVKNFMHLDVEPRFVAYLCATALVFMALLFFWVAPDVMKHEGHQWQNRAAMAAAGQLEPEERPFAVEEAFAATCAPCHGAGGQGDGPAAAALDPKPANFTTPEFWETRDREHIVTVIRQGGPAVGKSPLMASFGGQFTDEQIGELADFVIERFRPDGGAEQQPVEPAPAVAGGGPSPAEPAPAVAEGGPSPAEPAPAVAGGEPAPAEPAPGEEVAGAPAPVEPAPPPGLSEAEKARRAAFITRRLYR